MSIEKSLKEIKWSRHGAELIGVFPVIDDIENYKFTLPVSLKIDRDKLKTTMRRVAADKAGQYLPEKLIGAVLKARGGK